MQHNPHVFEAPRSSLDTGNIGSRSTETQRATNITQSQPHPNSFVSGAGDRIVASLPAFRLNRNPNVVILGDSLHVVV
jgi:hypothetical protein